MERAVSPQLEAADAVLAIPPHSAITAVWPTRIPVRRRVAAAEFSRTPCLFRGTVAPVIGVAEPPRPLGRQAEGIIAALPTAAIVAEDRSRETATAKDEVAIIVKAVLTIRTGIALLVGWSRKRIDAALVARSEIARTRAFFQSWRADTGAVLANLIAGTGRIAR